MYTEIKCHSLLPLDDIVKIVTHQDCIPEVGGALGGFEGFFGIFGSFMLELDLGNWV